MADPLPSASGEGVDYLPAAESEAHAVVGGVVKVLHRERARRTVAVEHPRVLAPGCVVLVPVDALKHVGGQERGRADRVVEYVAHHGGRQRTRGLEGRSRRVPNNGEKDQTSAPLRHTPLVHSNDRVVRAVPHCL